MDTNGDIFSNDIFTSDAETVAPETPALPDPDGSETGENFEFAGDADNVDAAYEEESAEEEPAFALPDDDDDLEQYQGLPLAQTLAQTRAYAREIAAKQAEFAQLQEQYAQYGDAEQVQRAMDVYRGFFTPVTDPETQAVIYHPETNLPLYTAKPALEKLAMTSPGRILGLVHDLNQMKDENGVGYVEKFLIDGLKLNPTQFQDFLAGKLVYPQAAQPQTNTIHPDDASWLQQTYGEKALAAFQKHIAPTGKDTFWNTVNNDPEEAKRLMDYALEQVKKDEEFATMQERLAKIDEQAKESERMEMEQFQHNLRQTSEAYIAEIQTTEIDKIVEKISSQWQFSTDPAKNKAAGVQIGVLLNAAVDPANTKIVAALAESLNLKIDPSFYANLQAAANKAAEVKRWEAVNSHPKLRAHRDDAALAAAKDQLESLLKNVRPVLNGIGGRLARNMGATAKQQSEALAATVNGLKQRPQVNGTAVNSTPQPRKGIFGTAEGWAEVGL